MKTKIITLTLALCVLLCFAGLTVSADISYTVSADIEYYTYSDGTVTFVLNFENISENCQMIASIHSPEGNLITATSSEIKANSNQIQEFSMACDSLPKNSTLDVVFVKCLDNMTPVGNPCSTGILENNNVIKLQGIIESSTDSTSSSTTIKDKVYVNVTSSPDNKFYINDRNMEAGDSNAMKLVGKKCIIFVEYNRFDDICTIKYLYETPNIQKIKINFEDIEAYSAPSYTYDDEEDEYVGERGIVKYYATESKTTTVTIDAFANIYYNGVANVTNLPSPSELIAMNGSMELALLDGQSTNADYDTIYITAYETFVVDEVKASATRVTNKIEGSNLPRIEYGEDDGDVRATLIGADGSEMNWAELVENDVLLVKWARTSSKNIFEAEVVKKVSGTITSLSGVMGTPTRKVKVDGAEYKVAISAEYDKAFKIGDEGIYYLDEAGKIIYAIKTNTNNYGYVIATAYAQVGDLVAKNQVKMVTKENELVVYNFAKKIKVTGDSRVYPAAEFFATYTNVSIDDIVLEALEDQVITYKLNEKDEIIAIEIAKNVSRFDEDYFSAYANGATVNMDAYDPEDMSFKVSGRTLYLSANTVVFNKDTVDEDDTKVVSLANLVEDQQLVDAIIYDVDEDDVIGCILLMSTNTICGDIKNAVFVTKVSSKINDEGIEVVYIEGFKDSETVTYSSENLDLATAADNIGKLVVPTFNANGTVRKLNLVSNGSTHDGKEAELSKCRGISGELTYIYSRNILYLDGTLGEQGGYSYKVRDTANIYVYDASLNEKIKYKTGVPLNYLSYSPSLGFYVNSNDINNDVTVYMYEREGIIADLVYYIHGDYTEEIEREEYVRSTNYGYVISTAAAQVGDLVAKNQVKMITKESELVVYDFAKRLTVTADNTVYPAAESFGTYTNVYSDDIALWAIEDQVITYKLNSKDEIIAIEIAKPVDNTDEDYFTTYANGAIVDMDAYNSDDMSFTVEEKKLYISDNTIIFNKDTYDLDDTQVVPLKKLVENQKLVNAIIYDVNDNDEIGCILLTRTNEFGDESETEPEDYIRSTNYGYVIATAAADYGDLIAKNQIKMVTKENELVVYNFAKRITVTADNRIYPAAEAFGTYTNVSIDDIDLSAIEDQVITYKLNAKDEIIAIEVAKTVARTDEDYFSAYNNGYILTMTAYDTYDKSFMVGGRRLYISDDTIVFNKDTVDPDNTQVVSLDILCDDQSLVGAVIYDVNDNDEIGCLLLTTTNEIRGDIANATFIVRVGLDNINDEGNEIFYVEGYKGLEPVRYTIEDLDFYEEVAKIGKLVIPTYNTNGTVKAFNLVNNGSDHGTKDGNNVGISGQLTYIDGRNIYLDGTLGVEDGREFRVKSSANVYVYDATSKAKVKFTVGEAVGYFAYEPDYGIYIDPEDTHNNVTVYAYEVDGNIVDLVYYIHE